MLKNPHSLQSLCLGPPPSFDHLEMLIFQSQVTIGETGISDIGEKVLVATNNFSNVGEPEQNDHPCSPRIMCFSLLLVFLWCFSCLLCCVFLNTPSGWNFWYFRAPRPFLKGAQKTHRRNLRKLTLESCKARKAGKWKAEWTVYLDVPDRKWMDQWLRSMGYVITYL